MARIETPAFFEYSFFNGHRTVDLTGWYYRFNMGRPDAEDIFRKAFPGHEGPIHPEARGPFFTREEAEKDLLATDEAEDDDE